MSLHNLEQVNEDAKVYIKSTPGRGNGTFAKENVRAKSQLMYVAKPLIVTLETARLPTNCYFCLRSAGEAALPTLPLEQDQKLKTCSGCKVVKFCDQECQTRAWSQYHRLECKLFARLHPRILPTTPRGLIRVIKQHKAGLLPVGGWDQLLALQSHQDDLRSMEGDQGHQRWQDLLLMTQAIKSYSGTELSLEVILQLLCILTVNSFTLTSPTFDSIGMALYPTTALLNHSCDPNAFVRFDVSLESHRPGLADPGNISIHALRDISNDEEITLSYVDTTFPFESRQTELRERYFFTCSCELCAVGPDTFRDLLPFKVSPELMEAGQEANKLLLNVSIDRDMQHTRIGEIHEAMVKLGRTGWPIHRDPWPRLRHMLLLGLLGSNRYNEALLQSAIFVRVLHPVMYDRQHHPIRLTQMWVFWNICRYCLETGMQSSNLSTQDRSKLRMLALLHCVLLDDIHRIMHQGVRMNGTFERTVEQAFETVSRENPVWHEYQRNTENVRKTMWTWLDIQIRGQLQKEALSQFDVDASWLAGS